MTMRQLQNSVNKRIKADGKSGQCRRCGKTLQQHYGNACCYKDEEVQFIAPAGHSRPAESEER